MQVSIEINLPKHLQSPGMVVAEMTFISESLIRSTLNLHREEGNQTSVILRMNESHCVNREDSAVTRDSWTLQV